MIAKISIYQYPKLIYTLLLYIPGLTVACESSIYPRVDWKVLKRPELPTDFYTLPISVQIQAPAPLEVFSFYPNLADWNCKTCIAEIDTNTLNILAPSTIIAL
jgi:hypothetical protein